MLRCGNCVGVDGAAGVCYDVVGMDVIVIMIDVVFVG